MKKQIFKISVFAIISLAITSCSSYSHSYRKSEVPDRDLSVAEKYVVDIKHDFTKIVKAQSGKHKSPSAAREEAYYNAIVDNNIHVVVDPVYKIKIGPKFLIFGGKSTASIVGFAGYYQNPRGLSKLETDNFDQKVKNLEKLSKISSLGLEQNETYIIDTKGATCCNGTDGKSSGQFGQAVLLNKTINKPSLIDQHNKLMNGSSTVNAGESTTQKTSVFLDEPQKPSGIKAFFAKQQKNMTTVKILKWAGIGILTAVLLGNVLN